MDYLFYTLVRLLALQEHLFGGISISGSIVIGKYVNMVAYENLFGGI